MQLIAVEKPRQLSVTQSTSNSLWYVHETTGEGEMEVARFVLKSDADLFVATLLLMPLLQTMTCDQLREWQQYRAETAASLAS